MLKIKELLEDFKGEMIQIYDTHVGKVCYKGHKDNCQYFHYFTVREWTVENDTIVITIRSQF